MFMAIFFILLFLVFIVLRLKVGSNHAVSLLIMKHNPFTTIETIILNSLSVFAKKREVGATWIDPRSFKLVLTLGVYVTGAAVTNIVFSKNK
jgi:hypothetical protein